MPNASLLEFYRTNAVPGRIGILHFDFAPAKLINWGQRGLTTDHLPSHWTHVFMFTETRDNMPWIVDSDVRIILPGFRRRKSGPQESPVRKWTGDRVDHAGILETNLTPDQVRRAVETTRELISQGFTYNLLSLAGAWFGAHRGNLAHHSILQMEKSMHCGHFLRVILKASGFDPFGPSILPENTAPELFSQNLPMTEEWRK